jgi:hypothetical protein
MTITWLIRPLLSLPLTVLLAAQPHATAAAIKAAFAGGVPWKRQEAKTANRPPNPIIAAPTGSDIPAP